MNVIKRKLNNDESSMKKLRTSIDEQEKTITCIENLSNDLFYEIFDYFDGITLYEAFSNLNIRFQNLLTQIKLRLKFDVPFLLDLNFPNFCNNIIFPNRHQIVSISIFNISVTDAFFSLITIDTSFNHLESLVVFGLQSINLLPLLLALTNLSRFFSLTIYIIDDIEDLSNAYQIIFRLPVLKYNQFSYDRNEIDILLSFNMNYQLSSLQYLIIDHSCTIYELIIMLSCTPQLRHLRCETLNQSNQHIEENERITLSYLTYISIDNCLLQFNDFEIFIKKIISQLQVLRIKTSNDRTYLDANRWERLFLQYMPHVYRFDFEYCEFIDYNFELMQYHLQLHQFISSFWINQRWIMELTIDTIDISSIEVTYSIHPYKKRWFELQELEMNYVNSTQLSQAVVLIILDIFNIDLDDFLINNISPILIILEIKHLIIECQDIFLGILIKLLYLLPNLNSLKICSLSLLQPRCLSREEAELFRMISKNNKITKVSIQDIVELEEIQCLIDLCPYMQYFEINFSTKIDLNLFVRFILMKTSRCISQLCILCLCVKKINDKMINEIQNMINLEQLLHHYAITYVSDKIYIQLK